MAQGFKLLKDFINEAAVYEREVFRNKTVRDLRLRLRKISKSIPDLVKRQTEQVSAVNSALESLLEIPSQMIGLRSIFRLQRAAGELGLAKTDVFSVVSYTDRADDCFTDVTAFVSDNEIILDRSVMHMLLCLDEIEQSANSLEWPATPWKRYTKYGSVKTKILDFKRQIQLLSKVM